MLFYTVSVVADGSMKSPDQNYRTVLPTRQKFLRKNDVAIDDTSLVQVTYETDDFCRYVTLTGNDRGDGITRPPAYAADALVVTKPGHALFLPIADCIGAVIYDGRQNILMLSHLGRQNLEQLGGTKCVQYLVDTHGSSPKDLEVWLSPAAGRAAYPLYSFDNRGLHDVANKQLVAAGVNASHITTSPIDSAIDTNYFSHSQYLKGDRETDGRHAVVAMMR